MEMTGEQLVAAPQKAVWDALNDPAVLKACVPGCESIERTGDNEYLVLMVARVGPVSAKFKGKLVLSDIKPPESYSISFEGQGGAAGFAKGGAHVRLAAEGLMTKLSYDVKASVGGKLAQIGSRLVDAAARKVADDFFRNFNEKVGGGGGGDGDTTLRPPKRDEDATLPAPPAKEAAHDEHGKPIPRDPELPDVSGTTLRFFAAGALVVFVVATRKGPGQDQVFHVLEPGSNPAAGGKVELQLDWERRHRLMRLHTALHLLGAVVKAAIEAQVNELVRTGTATRPLWITDAELDARPELVRTMSVAPPRGEGRVRLLEIPGIDLQACGGTHVADTAEIGALRVVRIRSEGKRNKRVTLELA